MMDIATFLHGFRFRNEIWALIVPTAMMGFDIVTGLLGAWKSKTFKSKKMRDGLSKKVGELEVIVIGELFSYGLGMPDYIMSAISMYIIFMETLSVAENLKKLGVPLPAFIYNALDTFDDAVNKSENLSQAMTKIAELEKTVEALQDKGKGK